MSEYHKIQTVFKRDPATKYKTLLEGEYTLPEFEFLKDCQWVFTEKVDGTNIRVMYDGEKVIFGGRTDRAQLYAPLVETLQEQFPVEKMRAVFNHPCVLYGEGYGEKIQKDGGNYVPDGVDFVLFDVNVGGVWLERDSVHDIASSLGIDRVPIVGEGTLYQAIENAREGFNSTWGDFRAEGYVMRPKVEMLTRRGSRVITKIKCKDFA